MANFNSQKITDITAVPSVMVKAAEAHGRMRVWYDSYTTEVGVAQDDTVTFARMPKGATIYNVTVTADALGSSVTVAVGDSGNASRFISATAMNTDNKVISSNVTAGIGYAYTAQTDMIITLGGGTPTAAKNIRVYVTYSLGD